MQFSVEEPTAIWAGPINWCPSAPARSNLNQRRGTGSPQLPDEVDRSSQSSVRESSPSGQSSPLRPFREDQSSLQLQLSRPPPRKSRGTSIPARYLFQLAGQCQALYEVSEFVSQPAIQIEEIFGVDEQLVNGLGVYEITPEEEDDESEDEDPAKLYSIGEKRFDEPTPAVEEPTKEINLGTEEDPRTVIISLNLNVEEESALIKVLKEYKDTFA